MNFGILHQYLNMADVVKFRHKLKYFIVVRHLMVQPNETYKIEKICTVCGNTEQLTLTRREAAFELFDIDKAFGKECRNCSSTSFTTAYQRLDLDYDLLKEWATNSDLHLMPQDEELLLADEKYLDMILQVLDTNSITDVKRDLLMEVLCIIVYDNTIEDNSQRDEQLKNRVIIELNKRQDKLKLADNWIMDYIKDVVYPQLDFGRQKAV